MNILEDITLFPHIEGVALQGKEMVVTIRSLVKEDMRDNDGRTVKKNVLVFQETRQTIILNKTNAMRIINLYGSEINDWPNKRVTLYAEKVKAFGKTTMAVRIREEAPPAVTPAQKAATDKRIKASVTAASDLYPEQAGDKPAANGNGNGNGNGHKPTPAEPIDWTAQALSATTLDGFCYAAYQLHTAVFTDANGVKRAYGSVIGGYGPEYNTAALDAIGVLANRLGDGVKKDEAISAAVRRFTELVTPGEAEAETAREAEQDPPFPALVATEAPAGNNYSE